MIPYLISNGQLPTKPTQEECPSDDLEEIWEVCIRCWEVNPDDRPTATEIARELVRDLNFYSCRRLITDCTDRECRWDCLIFRGSLPMPVGLTVSRSLPLTQQLWLHLQVTIPSAYGHCQKTENQWLYVINSQVTLGPYPRSHGRMMDCF